MKKQLLALSLVVATTTAIVFYPAQQSGAVTQAVKPGTATPAQGIAAIAAQHRRPRIDVVFALDTTGSMSGLIAAAKEKVWSIASTMAQADPAPDIRIGLVAYRDRGDAYVTQMVDLSSDLDSMYAKLMDFEAAGGGDGPESVNKALDDAVQRMSWSEDENTYKVVFLVGDAPPHMDYQNELQYPQIVRLANKRGIVINAIRCGKDENTRQAWQTIASLSQGEFFNVEQNGNAVAVATPFDKAIADLSAEMDETRLVFGDAEEQSKHIARQAATEKLHAKASVASRARRAAFNASTSGERNYLGDNDIVDAVAAGRVDVTSAPAASLPEPLRELAPQERVAAVKELESKREGLQKKIAALADKRDTFIGKRLEAEGGAKDSLDEKIYGAVRRQTAEMGLSYDAPAKY
jgi:Mg-chelatase subunit ChlD